MIVESKIEAFIVTLINNLQCPSIRFGRPDFLSAFLFVLKREERHSLESQ